eukprot:TRINITY_DN1865_c0_g1_i2.p1 TRINITY_DN1865_c0_g1~~TRINITY_DN1865_c0_g1_i2.p1  ORF type:complete len:107 (+),score=40.05 TRINITY_DN1865_c0_g1_i2:95-415(+)
MAKSLRSKVKRKFRNIKRDKIVAKNQSALKAKLEEIRKNPEAAAESVTLVTLAQLKDEEERKEQDGGDNDSVANNGEMETEGDSTISQVGTAVLDVKAFHQILCSG